jgi:ethanolamine utilization protein EutQ (cupin superfamily)
MEQCKVNFTSISWQTPSVGVRFKTYKENGKQLRLVEFTQEFIESDWCIKGHIGFIIEGKLEVNFNGNIVIFNPGDGLFITAGEKDKHISRVLSDVVKLILVEEI